MLGISFFVPRACLSGSMRRNVFWSHIGDLFVTRICGGLAYVSNTFFLDQVQPRINVGMAELSCKSLA
jgi:hypothetical protein